MAGRRHHTIPKFLLRGFASSVRDGVAKVWQHRKGTEGVETNIDNVGSTRDFYGKPGEGDLDDRITQLEGDVFAPVINRLRENASGEPILDEHIPSLIAHLAVRTRYIRESAVAIQVSMIEAITDELAKPEVTRAIIEKHLQKEGKTHNDVKVALVRDGLSPENAEILINQIQPHLPKVADLVFSSLEDDYPALLQLFRNSTGELKAITRKSSIEALSKNLSSPERVATYSRFTWHVVAPPVLLILGDSACLFETSGQRRFKPLDEKDDAIERIYLPVSSKRLLVGSVGASYPCVDFNKITKAIARCSLEYFVSSTPLPKDSHLVRGLGQWAGLLSREELNAHNKTLRENLLD